MQTANTDIDNKADVDPNLELQKQMNAAAPAGPAGGPSPIPPPPPLPTAPSNSPTMSTGKVGSAPAPLPGIAPPPPIQANGPANVNTQMSSTAMIPPPPPLPGAAPTSFLGRSEGFTPGQIDQFLPPPQQPNGIPLNTAPNVGPISTTMAIPGGTPSDPTGRNRQYLGASRDDGSPIWGDDQLEGSRYDPANVGQFNQDGTPKWVTSNPNLTQADYASRQNIAGLSTAQRSSAYQDLLKKYEGRLGQGNNGVALPADASAEDRTAFQYLQQLTTANETNPEALKSLTANSAIFGAPMKESDDPVYWAQHHLGDPNWKAPMATNGPGDGSYSTIQGGQTFTDPTKATAAFDAIQKQMKAGGSALLPTQMDGGTYRADAQAQIDRAAATGVPLTGSLPSSGGAPSEGGRPMLGTSVPLGNTGGAGGAGGAAGPAKYSANDVAIGSTILPNADPRLSNLRSLVDSSASSLASVDRGKLAGDIFKQISDAGAPQYEADLRRAKRVAWGGGQGGSSMERDLYRNTFTTRQEQLDNVKRALTNDATSGSIADQFGKVSALSGLEGQAFGEGASERGELRGERGYEGSQEQQAFDRALQQYLTQQQDVQNRFNRGVKLTELGGQGNPADFLNDFAKQYGVDPGVIQALAQQAGRSSVPTTSSSSSSPLSPFTLPPLPKSGGTPYAPDQIIPDGMAAV